MHIPQGLDGIIGLKDPTGLGGPGDHDPFPLKDRVLPVQGQVVGELAHDHMGDEPHIGLAFFNGMIGHGSGDHSHLIGNHAVRGHILGPFVDVDEQFAGLVLEFFGDLETDLLEGSSGLGADLFLFRDVQDDLDPFEVLGDGNAARVVAPGLGATLLGRLSLERHLGQGLNGHRGLFDGIDEQFIEHHLPGVALFRPPAVHPPEELLHLVLEHGDSALGSMQFPGKFLDLNLLLFNEFVGPGKRCDHGKVCNIKH